MICVWDDAIPTMFLEFVNLLTLTTSEGELRKSVKEFAEKHELDKFSFTASAHTISTCTNATQATPNGDEEQSSVSTF